MEITIITGPPYSGKGTQCKVLVNALGFKHISTGDRCRHEEKTGTRIGRIMAEFQERGKLVPDEIMKELFDQILNENLKEDGIILDGYPRTIPQVNDLMDLSTQKNIAITQVLNIEVPTSELLKRAKIRANSSDRMDDKDAAIHFKRIKDFEKFTLPAIDYLKTVTKVYTFDGLGTIEEVTERILEHLGNEKD